PILNLDPPEGMNSDDQQQVIEAVQQLNELRYEQHRDRDTMARSYAYELAGRLTNAAPEALNLQQETRQTLELYGADVTKPSFSRNCLLARRLVERGVRFVHLCHGDWDHHGNLQQGLSAMCQQTDQGCAALVADLRQRGLLDETLVVWGGEFGRTAVGQKSPTAGIGRDHQIAAFTMWLAGGGIRGGQTIGQTDELGCFPVTRPIPVHDLQATILHQLGLDHKRLIYHYQGRDFRLTDVGGELIPELVGK
ncbi:MAG: DUF1501 domain-containing protein, partial [Planctomycetes bacterium]|nr:DUF1501 domain-containing protein [Planctomycetota bacterium]